MSYISVKEAADKFGLSERRVQKLCETNRIAGAERISGVWIIPSDVEKPSDDRVTYLRDSEGFLSLSDVCSQLSISLATGRNWIRLGKLVPTGMNGKTPYFSEEYINNLKNDIEKGNNQALKSRRNKKYVSGRGLYNSYVSADCKGVDSVEKILNFISTESIELSDEMLRLLVANAAIQMISNRQFNARLFLKDYLIDKTSLGYYSLIIQDLIINENNAITMCKQMEYLFNIPFNWEENEDILGLLYISCLNTGDRKATGAYYTPTAVVRKLIDNLDIVDSTKKILDPCCGTGNFLLQLPKTIDVHNVYGNDIDSLSVIITRINIALKYQLENIQIVINNITNKNFLTDYVDSGFDYVVGNPPWGYEFSENEGVCLDFKYTTAKGTKTESFDVFTEQALSTVQKNGIVSFVLPEAILNVKSHEAIRALILNHTSIRYIEYLGNVFDGVQCPCIILQLVSTQSKLSTVGMTISLEGKTYQIHTEREIETSCFSFTMTDEEYSIIKKIENVSPVRYLANQASFALGIVTGNNKEYISNGKNSNNEMILKGSDLLKYRYIPSQNYISFKPESFQQVAPVELYRSPEKLLYRFICNQLVFAYDNAQTLSLNSCNILIPKIPELDIKYIMAILNSRIAQYYFKKKFNSVKILRSHIEQIPIPFPERIVQAEIISLVNELIEANLKETVQEKYDQIDKKISAMFEMTDIEYQDICRYLDSDNLFLI